ncbi:hypothetical protein [Pseudobacillus badius]|uniref:hypothetical protein n=1 Tax=Bacillus badius TaxID=1455 RepID=UPI0007B356F4|nr:hypothetical protein [Bacillus badius]KZR59878.1 hypothetical protein A3781_10360 [Bacillus badius]
MERRQLTEEQFDFVKQYVDLLGTIEEGFVYIIRSFEDYSHTESDRMLADIFSALYQAGQANDTLQRIFQAGLQETIQQFRNVAEQALELEASFTDLKRREQIIIEGLYPAFHNWAREMQRVLLPYVSI